MALTRKIFVSYSHDDVELFKEVRKHLDCLEHLSSEIWVDEVIRGGQQWNAEIEKALAAADLALLLLSPDFIESDYIRIHELPRLTQRARTNEIILYPVLLQTCGWDLIPDIKELEVRPKGLIPLATIPDQGRKETLAKMVGEIAELLKVESPVGSERSVQLLRQTLLANLEERDRTPHLIVSQVAKQTNTSADALFNVMRFIIEYQLLYSDNPTSFAELWLDDAKVRTELAKRSDLPQPMIVKTQFFFKTLAREDLWEAYFKALIDPKVGRMGQEDAGSLSLITVEDGFLAPQFLLAGLMARFEDDWRPVLQAYTRGIKARKILEGNFESVQASLWICWLVWGPSIPICACDQWLGATAYQYGYGDENNSLPVLDTGAVNRLSPIASGLVSESRNAIWVELTGRLRWGTWFLRERDGQAPGNQEDDDDPAYEPPPAPTASSAQQCAPAQAALYGQGGLVFDLDAVTKIHKQQKLYYSAYLWLMFLVAVKGGNQATGPALLRGETYPPWPDNPGQRSRIRDRHLWENLLPVFVHANVADPAALKFHKLDLVEKSVSTIRQVWNSRRELFKSEDVEKGIEFYLVCGSDYTGCGCKPKHPSTEPLVGLLRERLKACRDEDVAAAIVLPPGEETAETRPWGLAGYFSACHLPEMIHDYFTFIRELVEEGDKAGTGR